MISLPSPVGGRRFNGGRSSPCPIFILFYHVFNHEYSFMYLYLYFTCSSAICVFFRFLTKQFMMYINVK